MKASATTYVSAASYQPFGPESALSFGNGTTETMSYDQRYWPMRIRLLCANSHCERQHQDWEHREHAPSHGKSLEQRF